MFDRRLGLGLFALAFDLRSRGVWGVRRAERSQAHGYHTFGLCSADFVLSFFLELAKDWLVHIQYTALADYYPRCSACAKKGLPF